MQLDRGAEWWCQGVFCNISQSLCWITAEELSKGNFDADPDAAFKQDSCPWAFLGMVIY